MGGCPGRNPPHAVKCSIVGRKGQPLFHHDTQFSLPRLILSARAAPLVHLQVRRECVPNGSVFRHRNQSSLADEGRRQGWGLCCSVESRLGAQRFALPASGRVWILFESRENSKRENYRTPSISGGAKRRPLHAVVSWLRPHHQRLQGEACIPQAHPVYQCSATCVQQALPTAPLQ